MHTTRECGVLDAVPPERRAHSRLEVTRCCSTQQSTHKHTRHTHTHRQVRYLEHQGTCVCPVLNTQAAAAHQAHQAKKTHGRLHRRTCLYWHSAHMQQPQHSKTSRVAGVVPPPPTFLSFWHTSCTLPHQLHATGPVQGAADWTKVSPGMCHGASSSSIQLRTCTCKTRQHKASTSAESKKIRHGSPSDTAGGDASLQASLQSPTERCHWTSPRPCGKRAAVQCLETPQKQGSKMPRWRHKKGGAHGMT